MRYTTSFLLTVLIYTGLLSAGYVLWKHTPEEKPPATKAVAVSLAMFEIPQAPAPQPEPMPVEKPIEKPAEPEIKPQVEPVTPPPKLEPPKPIEKPIEKPIPKPEPKPQPESKPKPVVKKVEPKPEIEPVAKVPSKPVEPAPAPNKTETIEPSAPAPALPAVEKAIEPAYSPQQIANAEKTYLSTLAQQLAQFAQNTYPRRAKRRHWEGTVTLSFTIFPNGRIAEVRVIDSSRRDILDQAALDIIKERMHSHFKPFPDEIKRTQWQIQVPIRYELR